MNITALTIVMGYNNTDGNGHTMPDLPWSLWLLPKALQSDILQRIFFSKITFRGMPRKILRKAVSSSLLLVNDSCLGAKELPSPVGRLICNWPWRGVGGEVVISRGGWPCLCALWAWVPLHASPFALAPHRQELAGAVRKQDSRGRTVTWHGQTPVLAAIQTEEECGTGAPVHIRMYRDCSFIWGDF